MYIQWKKTSEITLGNIEITRNAAKEGHVRRHQIVAKTKKSRFLKNEYSQLRARHDQNPSVPPPPPPAPRLLERTAFYRWKIIEPTDKIVWILYRLIFFDVIQKIHSSQNQQVQKQGRNVEPKNDDIHDFTNNDSRLRSKNNRRKWNMNMTINQIILCYRGFTNRMNPQRERRAQERRHPRSHQ